MVASEKVLMRYDPDLPLRLATDASPYGLGAVLSYVTREGDERPIAYASRTLNKAEGNYSQIDKEGLSIVWAVKKFFNYLCERYFTLITDHQPLKFIFSPSRGIPAMSAARQQRYAIFLSGMNYTIGYRNSKANANADGLSRLPIPTTSPSSEDETSEKLFYTAIMDSAPLGPVIIARVSRQDPILSQVIKCVQQDIWPQNVTQALQPFYTRRHELTVQQNCLLWGYRLLVPQKLHKQILNMLNDGHLGIVRMKNLARSYFWWPGLDKDIEKMAKSCSGCAMSQPDPLLTPLHPWRWPDKPWQRIHIDYAGPFLNFMFLVIVDAHTKWVEIIPTATSTSSATINILSTTFARYGIPEQVVSDNGPQFTSEDFRAFMSSNGIKHTRSAPYHLATNGLAERMVQSFKNAMKAAKHDEGSMNLKLARFLLAYRNSPHSTTGESPASLMFGRRLRIRLDICTPRIQTHVTGKLQKQEQHHSQASPRTFSTGDHVLVRDYRGYERWQHGQISSQTGTHNYEIEISPEVIWRRHSDQIVLASNPVPPPQAT
ncbi:Pol polyprotein, partial [Plakobranchus ocellatus]